MEIALQIAAGVSRRAFCRSAATALASASTAFAAGTAAFGSPLGTSASGYDLVARVDRARILAAADKSMPRTPQTITSFPSPKNPGGLHDFFSQGDYWWPNPANPQGPYIVRDGLSNPENFLGHRQAMLTLSIDMPALTAAWLLTGQARYGQRAAEHLQAWFVRPATRMNPNLEYSQGVHGLSTGRSFGIIDTLQLVEVARAASLLGPAMLSSDDWSGVQGWFREYLGWLKTSEKGNTERTSLNNHAVTWALQAAEFARLVGDSATRSEVRDTYKTAFVPNQVALDGSFPKELARTKPYSYSIFNFDAMTMICQSLLDAGENLFRFALPDGRGICKAASFLFPYLKDKGAWPYPKDVEHFAELPARSPGLLFCGLECPAPGYLATWQTLDPDPTEYEIIRNYPVRQPLLWFPAESAAASFAAARQGKRGPR